MKFVEIEGTVININEIVYVTRNKSKYDPNITLNTVIKLTDGSVFECDNMYYMKLNNYIKPLKLERQ